jgi:uncharacterized protein (TIGR02391 family)
MKIETSIQLSPDQIYDILKIHPKIKEVTESLFKDGHYSQAIFEAFKMIESQVRKKSKMNDKEGSDLMHHAFDENNPILKINPLKNLSDKDEQYGFRFIFAGAMTGIRNPKAHEIIKQKDPITTLEYICLASLLMRILYKSKFVNKNILQKSS